MCCQLLHEFLDIISVLFCAVIASAKNRFLLITSDYFTSTGGSIWLAVLRSNENHSRWKGPRLRAFCSLAYSAARCLRVPPLVLMSCEVMRLIKDDKGRACARFARSPTRRLAVSGVPLWLAVFWSNKRQNRGREVFLLQRKKIMGPVILSCKRLLIFTKLSAHLCVLVRSRGMGPSNFWAG